MLCTATSVGFRHSWIWKLSGQLSQILVAGSRDGMLTAAHDISEGGLAITLAEMAMRADVGADFGYPMGSTRLCSCSPSRRRGQLLSFRAAKSFVSPRCAGPGTSRRPALASLIPNSAQMRVRPPERRFCRSAIPSPSPSMISAPPTRAPFPPFCPAAQQWGVSVVSGQLTATLRAD